MADAVKKRDRATYQEEYHAKNPEAATDRKDRERDQRGRAAAYWRFKLYLGRTFPALIKEVSQNIINQEEKKYRASLKERVKVVTGE